MNEINDLIRKSLEVDEILSHYIEIHNDIFKSSLRRIIPMPGVFQTIDFAKHYDSLSKLEDELKKIISAVDDRNGFANALKAYAQALLQTVSLLGDMCGNLLKKTQGELSSYTKKQYQRDLDAYHSCVERYQSLGAELNTDYERALHESIIMDVTKREDIQQVLSEYGQTPAFLVQLMERLVASGSSAILRKIGIISNLKYILDIYARDDWTDTDKFIAVSNYLEYGRRVR